MLPAKVTNYSEGVVHGLPIHIIGWFSWCCGPDRKKERLEMDINVQCSYSYNTCLMKQVVQLYSLPYL